MESRIHRRTLVARRIALVSILLLWNAALTGCNGVPSGCPGIGSLLFGGKSTSSGVSGASDGSGASGGSSSGGTIADSTASGDAGLGDAAPGGSGDQSTSAQGLLGVGGGDSSVAPLVTVATSIPDAPTSGALAPSSSTLGPLTLESTTPYAVADGGAIPVTVDPSGSGAGADQSTGAGTGAGAGAGAGPTLTLPPSILDPGVPAAGGPQQPGGIGVPGADTSVQPRLDPHAFVAALPLSAAPGDGAGLGTRAVWDLGHVPLVRNLIAGGANAFGGALDRDVNNAQLQKEWQSNPLPNFDIVNDQLYRGAEPSADGFQKLQQMGVGTVVNLRAEDGSEQAQVEALGMKYAPIPIADTGAPTQDQVDQLRQIMADPRDYPPPVFIHCAGGMFRTSTMVAAYQIATGALSNDQALEDARAHGLDPGWLNAGREARFIQNYGR